MEHRGSSFTVIGDPLDAAYSASATLSKTRNRFAEKIGLVYSDLTIWGGRMNPLRGPNAIAARTSWSHDMKILCGSGIPAAIIESGSHSYGIMRIILSGSDNVSGHALTSRAASQRDKMENSLRNCETNFYLIIDI